MKFFSWSFYLILLSTLVGCTNTPQEKEFQFKALSVQKRIMNSVNVDWQVHENVEAFCSNAFKKDVALFQTMKIGGEFKGCSIWKVRERTCVIATSSVTTHSVLGHELRHCFEGHFHR